MRSTGWLTHHRLQAFFILTYAISWSSWPAYASGLIPHMEFLPIGPLAAAVIVIALTEGRAGFHAWGRRLTGWRVGWIWYAVAVLLPVLVALWHLPLVIFGGLSITGLPTTFAITFLYVWLFNRTGGSVLLTLLFHNSQGTFTMGSFGFTGADATRVELVYFMVVVLAVLGTIALDRQAWRKAPRRATAVAALTFRRRPL